MTSKPEEELHMAMFLRLARAMAMWPLEGPARMPKRILYKSVVYIIGVLLTTVSLSLILRVFTSFEDMDGIATVIDFATVMVSAVFRYVNLFVRGVAFSRLVATVTKDFSFQSFNVGDKKTLAGMRSIGLKIGALYFFGSYLWILQMVVTPPIIYLTSNLTSIPLIFDSWAPFDLDEEPTHSIVLAMQTTVWLYMGYMYLLLDSFWYYVIILTIGQLQLIAFSYKNLLNKPIKKNFSQGILELQTKEVDDFDNLSFDISKEELIVINRCVEQHQRVRRFIKQIESLLAPIVLADFIHAIISITFLLLDILIAMDNEDLAKVLYLVEYLAVSVIHMFIYDFLGNELALQEQKIGEAIYGIPWYYSSQKLKAPIILTIAACRKPIRLTGGKFYNLTLEFYVAAMRTITSYFMVLYQLRGEGLEETT